MTGIVERLRTYAVEDHERGCRGREYDCSCGYDDKRDPLMTEAAAEIERLRAALEEIVDMEVYGFDIVSSNGSEVYCEGTNRFCRESDMITTRRIARAALAHGGDA